MAIQSHLFRRLEGHAPFAVICLEIDKEKKKFWSNANQMAQPAIW